MGGKSKSPRRKAGSAAKPRAAKKTAAKSKGKSTKSTKKASKPAKASKAKPKKAAAPKREAPKRAPTEPTVIESLVGGEVVPEGVPDEIDDKPTGPLKRFTRGVGKFFAKVTGREKTEGEEATTEPGSDATMELEAADLQPVEPAPKKRGKKPPPVPTAGD